MGMSKQVQVLPFCSTEEIFPIGSLRKWQVRIAQASFGHTTPRVVSGCVDTISMTACTSRSSASLTGSPWGGVMLVGSVVGEKIARGMEYAQKNKIPLIIFCTSGGARMQEGIFSLMQMAKTSAALSRLDDSGGVFISALTHPTTAGVLASFSTLADIVIAEPGALIGFTGPRVIEQTIRQTLPPGFQTAEFLLEHGMLDKIIDRKEIRDQLANILDYLVPQETVSPI